ncbi:hypothetical protein ACFL6U_10240 [Planctomycetota bacterium]
MLAKTCFVWMVLCVVAALAAALSLRDVNNHMFYQLRVCQADEGRLKQQLWQKQLRLENLTRPGQVMERLEGSPQP